MQGEQRIGDFLRICDRSGREVFASETIKEWNGLIVYCRFADKFRQPQDFVTGVKDDSRVNDPRPEGPDVFIGPGDVTPDML